MEILRQIMQVLARTNLSVRIVDEDGCAVLRLDAGSDI